MTITQITTDNPIINGREVPCTELVNENQEIERVVALDEAHHILNTWKEQDPDSRDYGWTTDPDDLDPSAMFVSWINQKGKLRTKVVSPFFDGTSSYNTYALDDLLSIPGIRPQRRHQLDITAEQRSVMGELHDPFIKFQETQQGTKPEQPEQIRVLEVKDDNHVTLYTIQPDGTYIVEMLINGRNPSCVTHSENSETPHLAELAKQNSDWFAVNDDLEAVQAALLSLLNEAVEAHKHHQSTERK